MFDKEFGDFFRVLNVAGVTKPSSPIEARLPLLHTAGFSQQQGARGCPRRPAQTPSALPQAHTAPMAPSCSSLAGQATPISLLFDLSLSLPLRPPLEVPQYLSSNPKRSFPASHSESHSPRAVCGCSREYVHILIFSMGLKAPLAQP